VSLFLFGGNWPDVYVAVVHYVMQTLFPHSCRTVVCDLRTGLDCVVCVQFGVVCVQLGVVCVQFGVVCVQLGVVCVQFGLVCVQFGVVCVQFGVVCVQLGVLCFHVRNSVSQVSYDIADLLIC
jgi:hypothetical protein